MRATVKVGPLPRKPNYRVRMGEPLAKCGVRKLSVTRALQRSDCMLEFKPMIRRVRQFLFVLIAFAVIGGNSSSFARAAADASPTMLAGMPCNMMMSHTGMQGDKPMTPCKGMSADCIKQMGCATDAALPARTVNLAIAAKVSGVDYWSAGPKLADFVREPEPLPPRTI